MKETGLLFKDGIVTKDDLNFLHTMPFDVGVKALKEFSKNNFCNVHIPPYTHTYNKYKRILQKIRNTTAYTNRVNILQRVDDMIDLINYTVFDEKYLNSIIYYTEKPVYDIEKFKKLLVGIFNILENCSKTTFHFILQELIPMKFEDFLYTKDSIVNDKKVVNYPAKLWNNIIEAYFTVNDNEKNKSIIINNLVELFDVLDLDEDLLKKVCKLMEVEYKSPENDGYDNLNTTLFRAHALLSDKDRNDLSQLTHYIYSHNYDFKLGESNIAQIINSSNMFSVLSIYVEYPLVNYDGVKLIGMLKDINVWAMLFKDGEFIRCVYIKNNKYKELIVSPINENIDVKLI